MTKRKLYTIIAILAVLDIAAAFWYAATHINSDGKGVELFGDDSTRAVAQADTLAQSQVADQFQAVEQNGYFESVPAQGGTPFTSVKRFMGRLPLSVNGNQRLSGLMDALSEKTFGLAGVSFSDNVANFVSHPTFNQVEPLAHKRLDHAPAVVKGWGNVQGIKVFPKLGSRCFLVMAIERSSYNGQTSQEAVTYLTYDREEQRVLSRDNIYNTALDNELVQLLNRHLDQQRRGYNHVSFVPDCIYPGKNGLVFVFPAGNVAPKAQGPVAVMLTYAQLAPFLTAGFAAKHKRDSGFRTYPEVSFAR